MRARAIRGALHALLAWLRRLFRRPKALPPAPDRDHLDPRVRTLDRDLRTELARLDPGRGAVRDTVVQAVTDFCDLRDLITGPGAFDLIGDLDLLGEAEAALRDLVARAPDVAVVVEVASSRTGRDERAAAGDALLAYRDLGRALSETTTAALRWSASRTTTDRRELEIAVDKLRRP